MALAGQFFVCVCVFPPLIQKGGPGRFSGSTIVICALIFSFRRPREKTMLPCSVCGKTFDRPSLLKRHMRTHTGEKPHICNICNKGFSTSSSLNTHRWVKSERVSQCTAVLSSVFQANSQWRKAAPVWGLWKEIHSIQQPLLPQDDPQQGGTGPASEQNFRSSQNWIKFQFDPH